MITELIAEIGPFIICSTLPGGAGGVVLFLWAFKRGHYRNNKYFAKFCIEIIGAMLTATFITMLFIGQSRYQIASAFIIGIGWSGIVQMVRIKITKIVEAVLGEKITGGGD